MNLFENFKNYFNIFFLKLINYYLYFPKIKFFLFLELQQPKVLGKSRPFIYLKKNNINYFNKKFNQHN